MSWGGIEEFLTLNEFFFKFYRDEIQIIFIT